MGWGRKGWDGTERDGRGRHCLGQLISCLVSVSTSGQISFRSFRDQINGLKPFSGAVMVNDPKLTSGSVSVVSGPIGDIISRLFGASQ